MKNLRFNARRDSNELALIEFLELSGCTVDRLNGKDIPDLLCCKAGTYFVIEVKTPAGKLKPGQKEWFAKARQMDAPAFVCSTIDDLKLALAVVDGA